MSNVSSQEMRIFFSPDGSDPMLLDTKAGLHALHAELEAFLASTASSAEFPAKTSHSPEPYQEFLGGLRLLKATGGTRQTVYRGLRRVDQHFKLTMTASNILRIARMPCAVTQGAT